MQNHSNERIQFCVCPLYCYCPSVVFHFHYIYLSLLFFFICRLVCWRWQRYSMASFDPRVHRFHLLFRVCAVQRDTLSYSVSGPLGSVDMMCSRYEHTSCNRASHRQPRLQQFEQLKNMSRIFCVCLFVASRKIQSSWEQNFEKCAHTRRYSDWTVYFTYGILAFLSIFAVSNKCTSVRVQYTVCLLVIKSSMRKCYCLKVFHVRVSCVYAMFVEHTHT